LTESLVDLIATEARVVPYIDIPIQHASDAMLSRMRRPERQETIRQKVAWLRERKPDIAIRTTAIVGFPGESDEDFRMLCDFAEEIQFERVGVFTYSEQEGTRASEFADDVPEVVKRDRQHELVDLQRAITEERLGRFVGRCADMLIDEVADPVEDGATHVGRVPWQADDVDGITRLQQGGWAVPGELLAVRLVSNEDYDFTAVPATTVAGP
jgi:ribosomal protein S12 methylthiotransferase